MRVRLGLMGLMGVMGVMGVMIVLASTPAYAERDLCARGTVHRGAPIDLDVKNADLHDVLRLLSDVGRVNLVVSSEVSGQVTLRLKGVAWDQVACTVASIHRLTIGVDGNVLLVRSRATSSGRRSEHQPLNSGAEAAALHRRTGARPS